MPDRDYATRKADALFMPQTECEYFSERQKVYECLCLTQCYCALEEKPCKFYRSKSKQTTHEPVAEGRATNAKVVSRATMMAMWREKQAGKSWSRIMDDYGISSRKLDNSRAYYGIPFGKRSPTAQTIPDEDLRAAVQMRGEGKDWKYISETLGYRTESIRDRLNRDAIKGIHYT